jgi:hypothetical protein
VKAGVGLVKVSDFVNTTKNASILTFGTYVDLSKSFRLIVDWENQVLSSEQDYSKVYGRTIPPYNYKTKMNSISIGLSYNILSR